MFDEDEYFYDEEAMKQIKPDQIMDETTGLTWADVCVGLRALKEDKGHDGPYTFEEFYEAICDAYVQPHLDSLVEKGLMERVMKRDGEMGYNLTAEGREVGEALDDMGR